MDTWSIPHWRRLNLENTDQVNVSAVVVVEDRNDLAELVDDLIVASHVRGQNATDHSFADALERVTIHQPEDVGSRVLEDIESH